MKRVAKFEKVSFENFKNSMSGLFNNVTDVSIDVDVVIDRMYDLLKLPKRATKFSAGYDFYAPVGFELDPGETIKIPTGIRCGMNTDWVLMIYPRSGLGFKYKVRLDNTVGVIDADYYFSDNEGHIFIKITNEGDKAVHIKRGDAFAQGIFIEYGITEDDHVEDGRNGGFGSTDKK